jgi:hypothetical protein
MTDKAFTSYAFPATANTPFVTGTNTVPRIMPDRYNDTINVKDWGAKGDGTTDDKAAILAAFDAAMAILTLQSYTAHGVIIFFPRGTYIIGSPPLLIGQRVANTDSRGSIAMVGAGRDATIIKGTYNSGALIFRNITDTNGEDNLFLIADLTLENDSVVAGTGAFATYSMQNAFRAENCHFIGQWAFALGDAFGIRFISCIFTCSGNGTNVLASNAAAGNYPTLAMDTQTGIVEKLSGSTGLFIFQGEAINCQFVGFDAGVCLAGPGVALISCVFSRCNVGAFLGVVSGLGVGHGSVSSGTILSNTFDRCKAGIYSENSTSVNISANLVTGTTGPSNPDTIVPGSSGITWSATAGGTATVTTSANHNLAGLGKIRITTSPVNWTSDLSGDQNVSVTVTAANKFTYPLPVDPTGSHPFVSGTWNYAIERAMVMREFQLSMAMANVLSAQAAIGSYDCNNFGGGGPDPGGQSGTIVVSTQMPYGFVQQPNNNNGIAADVTYMMCDVVPIVGVPPLAFVQYIDAIKRVGGDTEMTIITATTQGSFAGIVVDGGSAVNYKVCNDGAGNLIRIG